MLKSTIIISVLFLAITVYATPADSKGAELNLLESECVGEDIVDSGLAWECRGSCIGPLGGPPADIIRIYDPPSGSSASCDVLAASITTEKLINLQAICETTFRGDLMTKICLSCCPELICAPITPTKTPIPPQELDLLNSECIAEEIVNSGLTWRCQGTCPDTPPSPESPKEIIRTYDTSKGIFRAVSCDDISSQSGSEGLFDFRAISKMDFKCSLGNLCSLCCPELTCVLINLVEIPTPPQTPIPTVTPVPSPIPSPTPGKLFTFQCEHDLKRVFGSLKKLALKLGEDESCTLRFTNLEHGAFVDVSTNLRRGFRSSIRVSPVRGVTDADGELEFTISAINRGVDWVAWAVPNEDGKFEFNKRAYKEGRAWGMFVKVR